MRIIRFLGNIALVVGALLGVIAGAVWGAGQLGVVQPLIVISGSMEPGIMTGDLIIDRWVPTDEVAVGDVLSLDSELTGKLVTHRVIETTPQGDTWEIRMQGDNNDEADLEPYIVGDKVLTPFIRIPKGGTVVSKIMDPAVAMPVLLALVALLGVSLLDEQPRTAMRRVVRRVRRDPLVDELDDELAAVGIDVAHLQEMNDLDLKLFALGIDVGDLVEEPSDDLAVAASVSHNDRGAPDGLWDFAMPETDGVGLVTMPADDQSSFVGGLDPGLDDRRTPSLSG
ncbi:MAG: signal peptidase I [Ilumatobacteraceae bacterium]